MADYREISSDEKTAGPDQFIAIRVICNTATVLTHIKIGKK